MGRAQNSTRTAKRTRGRPFQKGMSGNPGGRPKVAEASAIIRTLFLEKGEDAIRRLYALCSHKDPRISLTAIKEVLDRVMGKAPQALDVKTTEIPVTEEQLVCELRQKLRKTDPKLVERLAKAVGE
jgi:hypothetical protein